MALQVNLLGASLMLREAAAQNSFVPSPLLAALVGTSTGAFCLALATGGQDRGQAIVVNEMVCLAGVHTGF